MLRFFSIHYCSKYINIVSFSVYSPDTKEEDVLPDPEVPENEASSSAAPVPETSTAETSNQELPPVEEKLVIPLDEEEPISPTVTLLDKEEDLDEEKEKRDHQERQEGTQIYCSQLPSFSSSCSCASSLQEHLHRQCSALLSKKRKCQTMERKQMFPPIQTPSWHQPLSPSASPEPQQHHNEVQQPHEQEQASKPEPESGASPSETPQPPGDTVESHKESMSEPPLLEPSQTLNLPKPSATDSPSAKPTLTVETPPLSPEEPVKEPTPEKSQDVLTEERHIEPSLTSFGYVQPTASATVEDALEAPTEEKSDTDVAQPETNDPVQTPDKTDESQVLHPTTSPSLEHLPDPPAVPDSGTAEVSQPPPDTVTELEPSGSQLVIPESKMEDFAGDISALSPSPSSPTSPSLSDIYADPPNDTEQNGNPVHGSSQKESVFMRLNNRIKALEMNMSLSGRYLEQLSQR